MTNNKINKNADKVTSGAPQKKRRNRLRAMTWSFLIIVISAMVLPTATYLIPGDNAYAQVNNDENQRANFWRAVRQGESGYSAVSGDETGVFINNGGQNWRQMRNGVIASYGGWAIIVSLISIAIFYLIRGKIKLSAQKSGVTVPRWELWERVMHWYTAIGFVVLAIRQLETHKSYQTIQQHVSFLIVLIRIV